MKIIIDENSKDKRLDRFLRKYFKKAPLSLIYKLIRENTKVNDKKKKENYILSEGDVIVIEKISGINDLITDSKEIFKNTKKNLDIIYEDENIIVVNKPYNLLVHGDRNEKKKTLSNFVLNYLHSKKEYDNNNLTFTPSPNNRLDRNTKGLVVFSKNAKTLRELNTLLKDSKQIEKYYYALVNGEIKNKRRITGQIIRDDKNNISKVILDSENDSQVLSGHNKETKIGLGNKKTDVDLDNAKFVETIVYPKKIVTAGNKKCSIVKVKLVTGRTHQIRASLKAIGHPLLFDKKYEGGEGLDAKGGSKKYGKEKRGEGYQTSYKLISFSLYFKGIKGELSYLNDKTISLKEEEVIKELTSAN